MTPSGPNLVVVGTGRSGTSLTASLFRRHELFRGEDPLESTEHNPDGYYESRAVNDLNNQLLLGDHFIEWTGWRIHQLKINVNGLAPALLKRLWLTAPRWLPPRRIPEWFLAQMRAQLREPFCLKDPRFAHTLRWWRQILPENTRCIAVFRPPAETVASIMKEASSELDVPREWLVRWCFQYWWRTYVRILQHARREPARWMLVDYEALLTQTGLEELERFSGWTIDRSAIKPSLRRSAREILPVPWSVGRLHRRLQRIARAHRART
jgi:hypothetical protein